MVLTNMKNGSKERKKSVMIMFKKKFLHFKKAETRTLMDFL